MPDLCDGSLSSFPFQGLHLPCQASILCMEAQCLEAVGHQRVGLVVVGSEVEGLYSLLWGALSHSATLMAQPPIKGIDNPPLPTCQNHPPRSMKRLTWSPPLPWLRGCTGGSSLAISQALEVAIPANMTPLHLNVGASRGSINVELRGAMKDHPPLVWPFVPICAIPTWALGWPVLPPYRPSLIQMPSGNTKRRFIPWGLPTHIK